MAWLTVCGARERPISWEGGRGRWGEYDGGDSMEGADDLTPKAEGG